MHNGKSADPPNFDCREFPMTDRNFAQLKSYAYDNTGINLSDHKKEMIYSRLARRIRTLGLENFDQYCALIESKKSPEHSDFINAITTNLTAFFREPHHFEFLANTAIAEVKARHTKDRRIRIWSAGCSTGEEPYSIAMTINSELGAAPWDTKILATDLDSEVLATATHGVYHGDRIENLSVENQRRYFLKERDGHGNVKVKAGLQRLISFKRLNLVEDWPMRGPFDIIFCRNVVIYFDKEIQRNLFERFADILVDGGYLFIGHSESLYRITDRFQSLGQTIYQKLA